MAKVIVHVNQHVIKHNAKHGSKLPALTIKHPSEGTLYAYAVVGRARVIDSNSQGRCALSCGARVWMEYDSSDFEIVGPSCDWPHMKNLLYAEEDAERAAYEQIAALGDAIAP
jgi:hypothetical protein